VKFSFDEDPQTGDLTEKARQEIEAYVDRTFRKGSGSTEVSKPAARAIDSGGEAI